VSVPLCALCPKPLPELAIEYGDPYCSSTCARADHGCSLPVLKAPPKPRKPGRATDAETAKQRRRRQARTADEPPADQRYRQAWGHDRGQDVVS